jgi:hypothetical protein
MNAYRRTLKSLIRRTFLLWERLGFHVTLNHFYQPVPELRMLKDALWTKRSEMVGVDLREESQLELLGSFVKRFKSEYDQFPQEPTSVPHQYWLNNRGYTVVDGEVLYCMVRHFKPRRVFEIGSGHSTRVTAQALLKNKEETGHAAELIAFEPYPKEFLKGSFPGLTELRRTLVQDVPLAEFTRLGENDILFIDSSHVLKICPG